MQANPGGWTAQSWEDGNYRQEGGGPRVTQSHPETKQDVDLGFVTGQEEF